MTFTLRPPDPGRVPGVALAVAAGRLVGAPFRLGGRDPATGLDCLGVVAAALAAIGHRATLPPTGTLRRLDRGTDARVAQAAGLIEVDPPSCEGDIVLVRCSSIQPHLLIAAGAARFIHAHAGLRRVVLSPLDPAWTIAGHWRLPEPA